MAKSWITECCSRLVYEPLHLKEVVYVLPASSVLGRLPVVLAKQGLSSTNTRAGLRSRAHCYDHDLKRTDSSHGAGDDCPMYFVNSSGLGWSPDI